VCTKGKDIASSIEFTAIFDIVGLDEAHAQCVSFFYKKISTLPAIPPPSIYIDDKYVTLVGYSVVCVKLYSIT
jgi:hypothetical protein